MVGWLDEAETQGWSLITAKHRLGLVEFEVGEPVRGRVAVGVHAVRSRVEPEVAAGRVGMELMLRVFGHIESYEGELGLKLPGPVTIALQQHVEAGVARLVDGATRRAQALGSDIFGFGELIYRTQPRAWENWEERWTEAFRDLEVKVQVEVVLAGTGLKAEPVRSR
jgi:spore germination protein KC